MTGSVAVVGSANLDIVLSLDSRPRPGETVMGNALVEMPGGKGVNQALATARIAATCFVGAVGNDSAGRRLRAALVDAHVDTTHLLQGNLPSGRAYVLLTPDGENSIVVMALANSQLSVDHVLHALDQLRPEVVLIQLEVPRPVTAAVIEWCQRESVRMVLNPSPADTTALANASHADPLIVNEHEGRVILGVSAEEESEVATQLAQRYRSVVVTAGARGAYVAVGGEVVNVAAPRVDEVVDTTGAGDAFAGTLAGHLALGLPLTHAVILANAEAARLVGLERIRR